MAHTPDNEAADVRRLIHELNNLLAVLHGHAEALSRSLDGEDPRRKHLDGIYDVLNRSTESVRRVSAAINGCVPELTPLSAPPVSMQGTETVLLVDDEAALRAVTGRFLGMNGYKVLEAGNAEEALAKFDGVGAEVDALVTDLMMEGMNGAELARRLRDRRPGLKVLFLSGHGVAEMRRHTGEEPEENFLTKPFRPRDLLLRLRRVLDAATADVAESG
jgi:CheY-like chemotaxis protein